jgi:hypothetical protein
VQKIQRDSQFWGGLLWVKDSFLRKQMVGGFHFEAAISIVVFYYSMKKCFGCFDVQYNITKLLLSEGFSR